LLNRPSTPFDEVYCGLDLAAGSTIVAAVSGGSDSLGLLISLHEHLKSTRPDVRLVAATIDHGLRANSAAEAASVGKICARLGLAHITGKWDGNKPRTGIAAAAREARYRLLAQVAEAHAAHIIVTGHTADDQAETVAMRAARGDGRGLAGMAPATLLDGRVWLVRPLLGQRRSLLRDFLKSRDIQWIDDPTNIDTAYERPRIRQHLAANGDIERWMAVSNQAATERMETGAHAASLIVRFVTRPAPGLFRVGRAIAKTPERETAIYALRILLATAGGRDMLPDEQPTARTIDRIALGERFRATLSRTVIDSRATGIFLYREQRGLPNAATYLPNDIWDGRYRIIAVPSFPIAPSGQTLAARDPVADVPQSILRAAWAAEPAAISGSTTQSLVEQRQAEPVMALWRQMLPSFDLAPAGAISRLLGIKQPHVSPYPGHGVGQA